MNKSNSIIWMVCALLIIAVFVYVLPTVKLQSDILELLPETAETALVKKAKKNYQAQISNKVIWLVGADGPELAYQASLEVQKRLTDAKLFKKQKDVDASEANTYQQLQKFRYQFISADDKRLLSDSPQKFLAKLKYTLYSSFSFFETATLNIDPLFTYGAYIQSLNDSQFSVYKDQAVIDYKDTSYFIIQTELLEKVSIEQQGALLDVMRDIKSQFSDVEILAAGLPLYMAYGVKSAQYEISLIGGFSLLAIFLLFMFFFKSARPIALSLCSLLFGILAGFSICAVFFDELFLITLVFGSALIGISIDYSFHYFCYVGAKRVKSADAEDRDLLKALMPSISLSMLSSVIAFFVLLASGFPGLQQLALFSTFGLFFSWLTVVLLYPRFSSNLATPRAFKLVDVFLDCWPAFFFKYKKLWLVIFLVATFLGIKSLSFSDSVQSLQTPPSELLLQENKIKNIFSIDSSSRFLLISASNEQQVVTTEKSIVKKLNALSPTVVGDHLSAAYPSIEQQRENYQFFKQQAFDSGLVKDFLDSIKMKPVQIQAIHDDFYKASSESINLDQWIKIVSAKWQRLWLGCDHNGCASIIALNSDIDSALIEPLLINNNKVELVDSVADINTVLEQYRLKSSLFVLFAIVIIFIFLMLFLNLHSAFYIMLTPILAIILSVVCLGAFNVSVNIFNIFALILVLGISLDYSIFYHLGQQHRKAAAVAVTLSLITSLLAFGLLAFSQTNAISSFGLTLAIGIVFAFLIAPLIPSKESGYD